MNEKEIKELEYHHFIILNQLINLALNINANITKRESIDIMCFLVEEDRAL